MGIKSELKKFCDSEDKRKIAEKERGINKREREREVGINKRERERNNEEMK